MTTETFTPAPPYIISGTGPYAVPHPYVTTDIEVYIDLDGVTTLVDPSDYSLSPTASEIEGDLTLDAGVASANDGGTLYILRLTEIEQGWAGVGSREVGLERQLDRLTRRQQDDGLNAGRSLRVTSGTIPPYAPADQTVPMWDEAVGKFVNGPKASDLANAEGYAEIASQKAADAAASASVAGGHQAGADAARTGAEAARDDVQDALTDIANNALDISLLQDTQKVSGTSGSGNDFEVTLTPTPATYYTGQRFSILLDRTATGAARLRVNGQAFKDVKRYNAAGSVVDLVAGQWQRGQVQEVYYDGTRFVCLTPVGATQADTEAGTNNSDFLTPLRGVQSYEAQRLVSSLGWGQTWQNKTASRTGGVSYRNTTGQPIVVSIRADADFAWTQVSPTNGNWVTVGGIAGNNDHPSVFIVPPGHYYRTSDGGAGIGVWAELRS